MTSLNPAVDERTFDEVWEAQAFALAVALHERGLFSWPEWTARVAAEASSADGYARWLAALERLIEDNEIADESTLGRYRDAWRHAAARTPHGVPIELQPCDFQQE
jgi:nitrile hydratase accessory protein